MLQYVTPETLTFLGTNPHVILQLLANQAVTKIDVAPSRWKAKVRNSGTQGFPPYQDKFGDRFQGTI